MNKKAKVPFYLLIPLDRKQPMTQPAAGKKAVVIYCKKFCCGIKLSKRDQPHLPQI